MKKYLGWIIALALVIALGVSAYLTFPRWGPLLPSGVFWLQEVLRSQDLGRLTTALVMTVVALGELIMALILRRRSASFEIELAALAQVHDKDLELARREHALLVKENSRLQTQLRLRNEMVRQELPGIGLVTIYRTLEILAELGLICEVHTGGNCRSYLMRRPSEHHHHLICSDCGTVVDFTDCDLSRLEQRLHRETGFKIENHLLEFAGQCQNCQRAQSWQ